MSTIWVDYSVGFQENQSSDLRSRTCSISYTINKDISFIEINAGEQKRCEQHFKYLVSLSFGQQRDTEGVLMHQ